MGESRLARRCSRRGAAVGVGMREVVHELQRREQGLVVLVLVCDDHAVDEAVGEQRRAGIEIDAVEHVERARADIGIERARAGRIEHRQGVALAPRVLERVVDVVVERVGRLGVGQLTNQPELLEVPDVCQIPAERRHQRRHLARLVGDRDRIEDPERAAARRFQRVHDLGLGDHVQATVEACADWLSRRSSAGHRPRAT